MDNFLRGLLPEPVLSSAQAKEAPAPGERVAKPRRVYIPRERGKNLWVGIAIPVIVVILVMANLSFLGLGAQPPTPEWGTMLGSERNQVFSAPHLVFFPGVAIMITVLAFNLLGDGLRDALDPRLSQQGKE